MKFSPIWLLICSLLVQSETILTAKPDLNPFTEEFVRYINEEASTTWTATLPKRFTNMEQVKPFLGAIFEPKALRATRRPTVKYNLENHELPDNFDARKQWKNCTSIGEIRDQSSCGSCWAFGAVEAMTDRVCIHSYGNRTADLSARDLLSCCESCGFGCNGGFPPMAWDFWKSNGLVTGGSKEDSKGCQPYPFPKCDHHSPKSKYEKCAEEIYDTPVCLRTCQPGFDRTYSNDKVYAISSYNVMADEKQIMYEIMTHGPVEAAFEVHADFMTYEKGIYQHVSGELLGGHAIRILGWGKEGDVPYWLIANSWNEEWGEAGYFRILRGKNECGIESEVTTGMPSI